ncbi:tripartite tricarboxylate transporter TctB family protein [Salinicola halophyticus]|uniref:tripartite tricarboxylate transporter TctB family protein n=1 Tax=Salinicola halophyticus TaxID=1808881 RepID=UPI003F4593B6
MKAISKGVAPTAGVCILLIVASTALIAIGTGLPLGSAMFPLVTLGAVGFLSAVLLVQSCLQSRHREASEGSSEKLGKVMLGLLCVLIYLAAVAKLGFYASTFLMIPLMSATFGYRRWERSLFGSALFTVMLYLLFDMAMGRSLPHGWLM